jgi:hypothetical protein
MFIVVIVVVEASKNLPFSLVWMPIMMSHISGCHNMTRNVPCDLRIIIISDDDAESMNNQKQYCYCLALLGFCFAAYHPSLSAPPSNKTLHKMLMSF